MTPDYENIRENFDPNIMNLDDNSIHELLTCLFSSDDQITPLLIGHEIIISTYPVYRDYQLPNIRKLITFINKLAWIEHTADWDLYLEVTFKDGTKDTTLGGYSEIIEITKTHIIIEGPTEEDDYKDTTSKYITERGYEYPIENLHSIIIKD